MRRDARGLFERTDEMKPRQVDELGEFRDRGFFVQMIFHCLVRSASASKIALESASIGPCRPKQSVYHKAAGPISARFQPRYC
jgi:hypothetical protein